MNLLFRIVVFVFACSSVAVALEIQDLQVALNPSGNARLSALCTFTTDASATISVSISDRLGVHRVPTSQEAAREHRIVLLGFVPDRAHTVYVSATANGETVHAEPVTVTTDRLPAITPPVRVVTSSPDEMEPGFTLIPTIHWPLTGPDEVGRAIIINHLGEIVWYYEADHGVTEIRRARNGNLFYQSGRRGHHYEIDMLGNIVRRWHASGTPKEDLHPDSIPVATDSFHHDFFEKPDGNLLVLSTEVREIADWYTSELDPFVERKTAPVIGDVLVEFAPATGTTLREWKVFDILDPHRIGYGSLGTGFYAETYRDVLDTFAHDWTHTNAIYYIPEEDAALLSSYHLDCIYKIDLAAGELKWILGDPTGWREPWSERVLTPKGDLEWPRHQHAVKYTPHGTILMYDNGTGGAVPFNERKKPEEMYSRAVEYGVDEAAMTVEQVWSYGGPKDEVFFSSFICDADYLPRTGNVLITDGGRTRGRDGSKDPHAGMGGQHWGRIFEVTHTTPAKKVFEVEFKAEPPEGWAIYRSERIPSLYP